MMEFVNINLSDLKWEYPFMPKGQDISYFIDNRKELVGVRTYKGFSYEVYREGLDIIFGIKMINSHRAYKAF